MSRSNPLTNHKQDLQYFIYGLDFLTMILEVLKKPFNPRPQPFESR